MIESISIWDIPLIVILMVSVLVFNHILNKDTNGLKFSDNAIGYE